MADLHSLALPHIARLHAYTPGLQPTETGWVKLNTNECPYPPSPRVAEALRREIGAEGASLRLYPNPKSTPVREAIAALHGREVPTLRPENVCVATAPTTSQSARAVFCTQDAARVSRCRAIRSIPCWSKSRTGAAT
jgi:histidinol-phosphate aminotransferase